MAAWKASVEKHASMHTLGGVQSTCRWCYIVNRSFLQLMSANKLEASHAMSGIWMLCVNCLTNEYQGKIMTTATLTPEWIVGWKRIDFLWQCIPHQLTQAASPLESTDFFPVHSSSSNPKWNGMDLYRCNSCKRFYWSDSLIGSYYS